MQIQDKVHVSNQNVTIFELLTLDMMLDKLDILLDVVSF
jgi:hypothetical protein